MRIRRLGWAGLEIEADDGTTAVIDLFTEVGPLERFIGAPHDELLAPEPASVSLALVTHLHFDHADPVALTRALKPGGLVLRPPHATGDGLETIALDPSEQGLADLETQVVEPWETVEHGPFKATAVPAVDGFGDPQVSWVLEADGHRILHAGDTIFHGSWWLTKMRLGPLDAAFLPVNGALVDLPHRQPHSALPAAMTPRDAAEAARILEASKTIPIHYDTLDNPPVYTQVDRPAQTFMEEAAARDVPARIVAPGEWVNFVQDTSARAA